MAESYVLLFDGESRTCFRVPLADFEQYFELAPIPDFYQFNAFAHDHLADCESYIRSLGFNHVRSTFLANGPPFAVAATFFFLPRLVDRRATESS